MDTIQQQLYRAFCERPHGLLGDEAVLGQLAAVLRAPPHTAVGLTLHTAKDLLGLDDAHADIALTILATLDVPRYPTVAAHLATTRST